METRGVVVIDPQGNVSQQLQALAIGNIDLFCVKSVGEARQVLFKHPCSVGLAVFDAPPSGLTQAAVEPLLASASLTEWIAIVAPPWLESPAFQVFVVGAFHDYHTLPLDLPRLRMTIGHACGKAGLRLSLNKKKSTESGRFGLYGSSPAMHAFFQQLEKITHTDQPILIGGETGTGKELVAQAIHTHSHRANSPFVVVNCGAIPANLIQSELFGYEKGAFTGATLRKIGSIEAANGGDLFLDEIGDLPLSQQVNLLRVLQERTITRLGSTQVIPVSCRIIAATHVDLEAAVRAGRFREDLYYRLNVAHLSLPPLRQRHGDIALLAETIFKRFAAGNARYRAKNFSSEALRAMNAYPWPGNVRELINRVHRAVIFSDNTLLSAADLGLEAYVKDVHNATLENARASLDRSLVESCLQAHAYNVSKAARQLGISRVTLYRMMNKHNIVVTPREDVLASKPPPSELALTHLP